MSQKEIFIGQYKVILCKREAIMMLSIIGIEAGYDMFVVIMLMNLFQNRIQ